MLANVVIYSIAIIGDTFVRIALRKFLVEQIADGDYDGSLGVWLFEWGGI